MTEIITSAPAKVILFGEHSVIFGAPAIAATVDRRIIVKLKTTSDSNIHLNFLDLQVSFPLPLAIGNLDLSSDSSRDQVLAFACFKLIYDNLSDTVKNDNTGLNVEVISNLPIGGGLGSSAGYSVTLTSAFLAYDYIKNGKETFVENGAITPQLLEEIKSLSHKCEMIFHGSPSGLDASTCILGGVVSFTKGGPVEKISDSLPLKLAIVDTKISRNTGEVIRKVDELRKRLPIIQTLYDGMKSVAEEATEEIKKSLQGGTAKFFDLVRINQGLLYALGVSHPVLDKIGIAVANMDVAFKLTGAGCGGNAILFLGPDLPMDQIKNALEEIDLSATIVNVGVPGLSLIINNP